MPDPPGLSLASDHESAGFCAVRAACAVSPVGASGGVMSTVTVVPAEWTLWFPAPSTATTSYVYTPSGLTDGSLNVVPLLDPASVAEPPAGVRYTS